MKRKAKEPEALKHLRSVPFVSQITYTPEREGSDRKLQIRTATGRFDLAAQTKGTYLSKSSFHRVEAWGRNLVQRERQKPILLARYIPRGVGLKLLESGVNFADAAGNIHLALGTNYNWTVLAFLDPNRNATERAVSQTYVQLLFVFAAEPASANSAVRQLEDQSGIGKSYIAQLRRQFIKDGLLIRRGGKYQIGPTDALSESLINGYSQILRPKLFRGRFRFAENSVDEFLENLKKAAPRVRYALTGGAAANMLQKYYRSSEVSLFASDASGLARELRLLKDQNGPVQILRPFGEIVFWREHLASPWLIYAELLNTNDPRAHDAAEEFRRAYLANESALS